MRKHLGLALLAGALIAPAAMAKSAGSLHIKKVPAKLRAAGKAKKVAGEKATVKAAKGKRSRKSEQI